MKNYMIKYILADDEQQKEIEFSVQSESLDKAVEALVTELGKSYNPANVDFTAIVENGNDIGEDGIYDAEISLAKYYS